MRKFNRMVVGKIKERLGSSYTEFAKLIGEDRIRTEAIVAGLVSPSIEVFLNLWDIATPEEREAMTESP
jgi:hypothetical protein